MEVAVHVDIPHRMQIQIGLNTYHALGPTRVFSPFSVKQGVLCNTWTRSQQQRSLGELS